MSPVAVVIPAVMLTNGAAASAIAYWRVRTRFHAIAFFVIGAIWPLVGVWYALRAAGTPDAEDRPDPS
jgi:hypothetical protein